MEERSIRVEIAGRAYPLTIQQDEEAHVRAAAKDIDESMQRLRENYPMTDKQDLLAMAALEVCVRVMNSSTGLVQEAIEAEVGKLEALLPKIVTKETTKAG